MSARFYFALALACLVVSTPVFAADQPPVKSYKELSPQEKANYERLMKELEAAKKQGAQSGQPATGK